MRLRKNLKRTAAAALALSMAVSAATPAMAGYKIDMSKVNGDVTITKDEDGNVSVTGSTEGIEHDETTSDDDITITGDNTVHEDDATATAENGTPVTQEAPEADSTEEAAPAENAEDTTGGIATMDLTEEDYAHAAEDTDEDTTEDAPKAEGPARTVEETEDGTVITYDDYDVDPDAQVVKPTLKTARSTDKKDEEKTYTQQTDTSTNAIARAAKAAADYVIKIINKVSGKENALNVTLDNVNIDVSDTGDSETPGKAALSVEGEGDVNLELDGSNTLKSGVLHAGLEKNDSTSTGVLTIQDEDNNGSLTATGGSYGAGIGGASSLTDNGESTSNLTIAGGTINATSGSNGAGIGGGGAAAGTAGNGEVTIKGGSITAKASGATRDQTTGAGIGGGGVFNGTGGKGNVSITGGTITSASSSYGAGIGGGGVMFVGTAGEGNVTITNGATVKEATSFCGAGIGGGGSGFTSSTTKGAAGFVEIKDSTVETARSDYGAGIGNGGGDTQTSARGSVTLENATIGKFEKDENGNLKKDANGNPILEAGTGAISSGADAIGSGQNTPIGTGSVTKDSSSAVASKGSGDTETKVEEPTHLHNGSWKIVTDATCTTDGLKKLICTSDEGREELIRYEVIPATGHDWGEWVSDGKGNRTHTCKNCGATKTEADPDYRPNNGDDSSDAATALELCVTDAAGVNVPFTVTQNGTVRTYTANADVATLNGNMDTLRYLKEHGAETIVFATNQQTSQFNIDDVLAQSTGNESFYLAHNGAEEAQVVVIG